MSQEDKLKIIGELLLMRISNNSKLEAVKSILDYKPEEIRGVMEIGWEEAPKGDDLELGELPENIKFMGEDKDGNGIYKVS